MLLQIHPENPDPRKIKMVVEALKSGGTIIYPTDTIYGLGCDIFQPKAVENICRIKGIQTKNAKLSFICSDLSELSRYTRGIDTPTFRLLKNLLPGPYTMIFNSSKEVPKIVKAKKDTVGIRVPDNKISNAMISELDNPIISSSLPIEQDVRYYTDPYIINEIFGHQVDYVIDGGAGGYIGSTIIDFTGKDATVIRQGLGSTELLA